MTEHLVTAAVVDRHGLVSRRDFLRAVGIGAGAMGALGWQDRLIAAAPAMKQRGKAIIVLWMQGGPTQFETFDPKSHSQTKAIATAIPGVQIGEFWPKVAGAMKDITLLRSMTNKEGNHQRATYQLHTGSLPVATVRVPSVASSIVSRVGPEDFDLPSFVSILGPSASSGFLPVRHGPFRVQDPSQMPANTQFAGTQQRYEERLNLLAELEEGYAQAGARRQVESHRSLYQMASEMVLSQRLKAFDLAGESQSVRDRYGSSSFGQACLLARRLVEVGVTYVEVQLGSWDHHNDLVERAKTLSERCDPAFAALVADLKERGLFDDTLVVWMGEFGRTPKVNARAGRDHFPRAFSAAVAGGGTPGGTVIGKTAADGSSVADRPVQALDLLHTICLLMGVDPTEENYSPIGRPIKIVDGGSPIPELLG